MSPETYMRLRRESMRRQRPKRDGLKNMHHPGVSRYPDTTATDGSGPTWHFKLRGDHRDQVALAKLRQLQETERILNHQRRRRVMWQNTAKAVKVLLAITIVGFLLWCLRDLLLTAQQALDVLENPGQ